MRRAGLPSNSALQIQCIVIMKLMHQSCMNKFDLEYFSECERETRYPALGGLGTQRLVCMYQCIRVRAKVR